LCVLKVPLEYFSKPCQKLTLKDVEAFEKAMSSGELKSMKKKPYSHSMRVDIRIALRIFLRWKLGHRAVKLTDWFDCRDVIKTPEYLKETEVEKLYRHCKSAQERFLVAVLFDSGARAEEFHNIRFEDIQLPEGKENYVRLALKEEYSKTLGRTISLYWKHSFEAVKEYLDERIRDGIKSRDPIFNGTYDSARLFLQRLGRRVLDKHIHFHLFRHSSATYFANRLNRQELCIRYGWKFSSNMPDVYIARAGVENRDLDQKFASTEMGALKDKLVMQEQQDKIKDDRIRQLEATVAEIQQNVFTVARVVAMKPSIEEVEAALTRKRKTAA
jgi:integrase